MVPSPKHEVEKNVAGIIETLHTIDADVFLLQEVATQSILNHFVNLRAAIADALPTYTHHYVPQVYVPFLPTPLIGSHGMMIMTKHHHTLMRIYARRLMTKEYYYGILPRSVWVLGVELADPLVHILTSHLSAYDSNANLRYAQCKEISEYLATRSLDAPVIMGADWNMALHKDRTEHPYERVAHPLPVDCLPCEWRVLADPTTPTVRRVEKPWDGTNQTAIIDGFVVSPDIEGIVKTHSVDFAYSDHQPVVLETILHQGHL